MPIKEISNPSSFLTIIHGDGSVEQIGNSVDGGNSNSYYTGNMIKGSNIDGTVITGGWNLDTTSETRLVTRLDGDQSGFVNFEFIANINTGSCTILKSYDGTKWVDLPNPYTVVKGINNVAVWIDNRANNLLTLDVSTSTFNIDFTDISIGEILPISTHYTFNNQTLLEAMPATKAFTTVDLALIQADTTLLARLALGEDYAGGLSLLAVDVYKHFAFMEYSGADCIDTKDGTIATITNYV